MWIEIAITWDLLIKYGISRQITAGYWEWFGYAARSYASILGVSESGRIEMAAQ
jgi:hypothetical protein